MCFSILCVCMNVCVCVCIYICVYIYIYIYIIIHRQTVSLYYNSSVWLDTQDVWSWDWNLPNFTLDLVFYCSASRQHVSSGIIRHYVVAFVCLHFALPDTRVLNSMKSFTVCEWHLLIALPECSIYLYIYIYIYIYILTDPLA